VHWSAKKVIAGSTCKHRINNQQLFPGGYVLYFDFLATPYKAAFHAG